MIFEKKLFLVSVVLVFLVTGVFNYFKLDEHFYYILMIIIIVQYIVLSIYHSYRLEKKKKRLHSAVVWDEAGLWLGKGRGG